MADPALLAFSDRVLLWTLTALTVLMFVLMIRVPVHAVRRQRRSRYAGKTFGTLFTVAVFLLLSITLQRYAVGYYTERVLPGSSDGLNFAERISDSLLHGLQTFSMDEDYSVWLSNGKSMMTALCGGSGLAGTVYGLILSLVHVAAPVVGGAFVLNILMRFLPKLRLGFYECFCRHQKKYYFSELNARALILAENLCDSSQHPASEGKFRRPAVIFTDVYDDGEDETRSELLEAAKALGAVCLKEDLLRIVSKRGKGSLKEYLLIDENDLSNIKTFAALSADGLCERLDSTVIRIFYENDSYSLTEKQIIDRIRANYAKRFGEAEAERRAPSVDRVRGVQNMIYRLLTGYPLYEPLLSVPAEEDAHTLNIGIAGVGSIGTEMLLAASWCGQIPGCSLSINAVSLQSEAEFRGLLDKINPEIRQSAAAGSPLLNVFPEDGQAQTQNPPYLTIRYAQADTALSDPASLICTELPAPGGSSAEPRSTLCLTDCDYLLISLGSDARNIDAAERFRRAAAAKRIRSGGRTRDMFIVCVVYDSDLADALNSSPDSIGQDGLRIRTRAIGSLRDIYSIDNIYMKSTEQSAQAMNRSYEGTDSAPDLAEEMRLRTQNIYNYMSSTARAIHVKYKVYASMRYLQKCGRTETAERLRALLTEFTEYRTPESLLLPAAKALREQMLSEFAACADPETGAPQLNALLRWGEHRRWCAYMRSVGFMLRSDGREKDIVLRLHPTLVEAKHPLTAQTDRPDLLDEIGRQMNTVFKDNDDPLKGI